MLTYEEQAAIRQAVQRGWPISQETMIRLLAEVEVLGEATTVMRDFVQEVAELDITTSDGQFAYECPLCGNTGDSEEHYEDCLVLTAGSLVSAVDRKISQLP